MSMSHATLPVVVVGAGPAGLATSHELMQRGIEHLVLERGDKVAYMWTRLYDSLTLHTGKHMSALPGMPFSSSTPLFPSRSGFLDYLHRYVTTFQLPVKTGCDVLGIDRRDRQWCIRTTEGDMGARALVMATGILSNPNIPEFAGRGRFGGRVIHSVDYHRPDSFVGRRVLVIGVGNSGGEISAELARAGARVTIVVRSGATVLPRQLFGIPIQYFSCMLVRFPKKVQQTIVEVTGRLSGLRRGAPVIPRAARSSCPDVPLIGFHLVEAIREGLIRVKGCVTEFTEEGARFQDGSIEHFDDVMLATGYRAAVGILQGLIHLDRCGFALRTRRVVSVDQPSLYFVGHNYDGTGGLFNIARDSRLVGEIIVAELSKQPRRSGLISERDSVQTRTEKSQARSER